MTVRINDFIVDMPPTIASTFYSLPEADQTALLHEFFETILDLKAMEDAEAHNREHPRKYTMDEIRKELDLA